ncbi:guanylate kinase [Polynucleobacter sp. SHI8]|uniref:guanylate kinase n=1 Tax=unclassified Polynucleobacter TaxID=2640945 RepID=UPI0024913C1D|nr:MULTISPECIES: guanylate kinase [unclassified Polynucleobacter]BDW11569.1 guanylate kinase [Polynucleobacter sp. SHI2]BDW14016.1 guanylate kinase [Polynucleobacter sp. SHI8]
MIYSGSMILVVAPSGAGKSSLVSALLTTDPTLSLSVSFTTRSPRPGEVEGVNYHFISENDFLSRKEQGDFLEWAYVHGNYYGTSRSWIMEKMEQGQDVILEIDWQGAQQIQKIVPQAIWVFILPPSLNTLQERLRNRGQDDEATIQRRIQAAHDELSHLSEANYLVVNDLFQAALFELRQIISASRLRTIPQLLRHSSLIENLTSSGK